MTFDTSLLMNIPCGQLTFGWIEKRCKQATGFNDKVFGGKSLILTGDPGQLPPVADKPLYHAKPSNAVGEHGYQAYHMFDKVVKLTVNQPVQGMKKKTERTAGVSYVAIISRVKSLASCVIEPMTYERLISLKSSANLQYRVDQLAQPTSCAFREMNH